MDEHAFSLNGDALGVSDIADCECLGAFNPLDMCLCAQRLSERCATQVPQSQGAGIGRIARLVRGSAEDVVEDQRTYTAVNVTRRTLVGGAKNEVSMHGAVGIIV